MQMQNSVEARQKMGRGGAASGAAGDANGATDDKRRRGIREGAATRIVGLGFVLCGRAYVLLWVNYSEFENEVTCHIAGSRRQLGRYWS